jgi:hypothetical protein
VLKNCQRLVEVAGKFHQNFIVMGIAKRPTRKDTLKFFSGRMTSAANANEGRLDNSCVAEPVE